MLGPVHIEDMDFLLEGDDSISPKVKNISPEIVLTCFAMLKIQNEVV